MRECLLIDDDLDDQEIFIMCVNAVSKKIKCTVMNNGVDALAMLTVNEEYFPDFIFIDVNMPKMNGIECLKAVKKTDRLKNAKVFMYSTTSERSMVTETKRLGGDDFIIKPTKTAELKETLIKIFGIDSESI